MSNAKSEIVKTHVRVLCAREIFTPFLSEGKLLKLWWPGTESNRRRRPFQSRLPLCRSGLKSTNVPVGEELMPYWI